MLGAFAAAGGASGVGAAAQTLSRRLSFAAASRISDSLQLTWRCTLDRQIEHLLRRAGFGARPDELDALRRRCRSRRRSTRCSTTSAIPDDVDSKIGQARLRRHDDRAAQFSPQPNIVDARQRWLFRMVHTDRPLQEKMTLFWHNHFATGYTQDRRRARRRRRRALHGGEAVRGSRAACAARSRCCATTRSATSATSWSTSRRTRRCWSGSTAAPTRKAKPQENFGREIMELFTIGVGNYTEADVYAARARVHRLEPGAAGRRRRRLAALRVRLQRRPARHDGEDVQLSDLRRRQQDDSGAVGGRRHAGRHRFHQRAGRATRIPARYLATKLYRFFVSEFGDVDASVRRPRSPTSICRAATT